MTLKLSKYGKMSCLLLILRNKHFLKVSTVYFRFPTYFVLFHKYHVAPLGFIADTHSLLS